MDSAPRVSASLYVGDLPIDLPNPEDALFTMFNKVGMVMSIKVCRDINTQRSLGYAYVNFQAPADAERALEQLNYTEIIPGRIIRIMWSSRDPNTRRATGTNLFVKNLDASVNTRQLRDIFATFGTILSCKLAMDENGVSRGYGFVHFEKEESAKKAMNLNGTTVGSQPVEVLPFVKKTEREAEAVKTFTNVYMKNIRADVTEEQLRDALRECGAVESLFLSGHAQHPTKFALVTFQSHESAVSAIDKLNDRTNAALTDAETKLYVGRAVKKSDRSKVGSPSAQNLYQSQGRNIYVKHLDDTMTTQQLESLFSQFGKITSCALMKDASGNFRGFGFVCFESKESATAAIREMNGKVISRRPLYVSQAQQRDMRHQVLDEQRKAMLQQQQRMAMQMNMYGPQFRPGFPMPPFMQQPFGMMPLAQPAGRRGPQAMMPMRAPNMSMLPGVMPPPRGPGIPQRMPMQPGGMPMMPAQQMRYTQPAPQPPRQSGINAAQLAKMTPEEQKNSLGERLYAKISEMQPVQAAKITGMLLEMDTPEILNVLEDQRTLLQKVQEAIHVLQQHEAGH
jgi:polyadenylate-binding protein